MSEVFDKMTKVERRMSHVEYEAGKKLVNYEEMYKVCDQLNNKIDDKDQEIEQMKALFMKEIDTLKEVVQDDLQARAGTRPEVYDISDSVARNASMPYAEAP